MPPPPVVPPLSREALARLASEPAETPVPASPKAATPPTSVQPPMGASSYWEQVMGGKGALWVGSLATFFALAFFLAYTWQFLGEAARLAFGFGAGALLLALGEYARGRAERWFSEGVSGVGVAVLYLSIWAGAQRYHLFSLELASR